MKTYNIKGMTCQHCVKTVKEALRKLPGVKTVDVDLKQGTVSVEGDVEKSAIKKAIEKEGYELT
ncbi:Copper chaperone CopZ [Commensalibacter sp. Nvir]|uniref:CopZ family metallochaperone n=1 Tax=Commensalibacter sp. Nvir TaxID=3069817 RepID=UPI002D65EC95|nr:Copper chaperone CopZ [Commensalibacter sp. Nvir]